MLLLIKLDATRIPNKNEAIKFTIEVFLILNPILIFKLSFINILNINPNVLPNKTKIIELIFTLYIFIQPFVILLGSSRNLLEANSTLTQISLSLTSQLRITDKDVPILSTNNSLASI